jgi:hypothetical protein
MFLLTIAHRKVISNPHQILVGHFCRFLMDSLIFEVQSKHSSNCDGGSII